MARKRKSKPTPSRRSEKQQVKDRLSHAQDDARRLEVLDTPGPLPPEETLKPEKVDPSSQSERRFPRLIGTAIRRGWAVPEEKKPEFVDELASVLEDPHAKAMAKIFAFNALVKGDESQRERDQEYVKLDRVLAMWRGVLEAVRRHVADVEVLKRITDDVLRLWPSPAQVDVVDGVVVTVKIGGDTDANNKTHEDA